MGWSWTPGDVDVPELTERGSFREVVLAGRLAAALSRINLRDGQPWLDDNRVAKSIRDLERAAGHQLMEVNQAATELLLKGTVVDGLPDWDNGRPQPTRYIDFEHPENNDFLVINQFKVELTSGRGHVIPDAVLFANGIPIVVAEFKSPGIENPIHEAINQLLRYSNQRRELFPTLYDDHEGVEKLFHTNQLLIASDFFEARAATIGAPPEAYLEWADTSPVPLGTVAEELGIISADVGANNYSPLLEEAKGELLAIGPEQSECVGTPLFFRRQEQRPEDLRKAQGAALQSQQVLTAGMLRPAHLLDLIRNFTVFQQVDGKTRKVVAHDLLQAVARVNRTCGRKKCGYVVDYIGVARHLNEALKEYDGEDTEGALIDINVELPVERIRQEVAKVGFWKNSDQRELLTRHLVRDLNASGVCLPGKERDIAQRLVALAKENHVNLVKK
jgi:type I restriction enzyme R subunit